MKIDSGLGAISTCIVPMSLGRRRRFGVISNCSYVFHFPVCILRLEELLWEKEDGR